MAIDFSLFHNFEKVKLDILHLHLQAEIAISLSTPRVLHPRGVTSGVSFQTDGFNLGQFTLVLLLREDKLLIL